MDTPNCTASRPWIEAAREACAAVAPAERDTLIAAVLRAYTSEVNRRAENKMLRTGKLEGSHYAAMREINQELHI